MIDKLKKKEDDEKGSKLKYESKTKSNCISLSFYKNQRNNYKEKCTKYYSKRREKKNEK